jgi:sugar phosphate permease
MVKYETRLIWVLTITFGFVFLDRNAANFLMPFIADALHFNNQQIGLVASALSLTRAVAAFPVIVIFSFIGLLVPLAALLFQGSLFVLGTLIFIGWSASGTFPLFMGTVPSETIPARYVATSLGMVVGLGEILGGVGAPAIAGRAADLYGLQAPVILMAICAMVGTVLALFLRETAPMRLPQHWLSAPGDQCP